MRIVRSLIRLGGFLALVSGFTLSEIHAQNENDAGGFVYQSQSGAFSEPLVNDESARTLQMLTERMNLEAAQDTDPENLMLEGLLELLSVEQRAGSEKPLVVIVSDTHGDMENTRLMFDQVKEQARLRGIKEIFFVHLGDWTQGNSPEELSEMLKFFREEAELDQDHLYAGRGNMENGGFYVVRRSTRERRIQASEDLIDQYATPVQSVDHNRPAHDDELGMIQIDDLTLAVSHKPLLELPRRGEDVDRPLVPRTFRQRNLRRFVGHIERDTIHTMQDDAIIPSKVDAYVSVHTHIGVLGILSARNEGNERRRILHINSGTTFEDPRVRGSRGTYVTIDLNAENRTARAHSIQEHGKIIAWQTLKESSHWGPRPPVLKSGEAAGRCNTFMHEYAEAAGLRDRYVAPLREFGGHIIRRWTPN